MSELPVLYSFRRCPYAMRARLALAISQTEVELREVVLRHKPPALLRASSKATVPVLVLPNGTVLAESLSIMQWALERHDPEDWLRASPGECDGLALISACDGPFKVALDRCKYPERATKDQVAHAWRDAETWLATLEHCLDHRAALCGNQCSLADAAIFPFVRQFAAVDPARWLAMPLPKLRLWLSGWLEGQLFRNVMDKFPVWQEGSPPIRLFAAVR